MTVSELIRTKRAVRLFTGGPLSEEATRSILNAGRRSQSSKNTQPWHFIAIRDRETLRHLSQCGAYAGHLAGAPFAVALISSTTEGFDLGQAAAYMQLAAWDLGIGSCIASMWEPERAKAILGVPQDLHFDVAISFGYPLHSGEQPHPPNPNRRKPFDEVVFWERWGG
ncbi:MAG TPA: nitroreductase family protein [Ktedonobacteraceae bacterium]